MLHIGLVIPVLTQFQMAVDLVASARSIQHLETFIVPQYREQLPLAGAWNRGAKEAFRKKCDFALILNDDILLSPHAIDDMVDAFVSPLGDGIVMTTGTNVRGVMTPDEVLAHESTGEAFTLSENPDFACFMIPPSTLEIVGDFDEGFFPAYFEDNDYHRRINLLGKHAYSVSTAIMMHYGSQTQNASPLQPVVTPAAFVQNRARYASKWGGEPGSETFITPFGR